MNRSGAQIRASENQSKFIQDRISQVEQHFGNLCQSFGAFSRKLGRVRDKGDDVSKSIMDYSERESFNRTTQFALKDFAESFSAVQDYREAEIKRIEAKIIEPLSLYGASCKHAKERLKSAFAARDKEMKQKKNLDKVKDKAPSDRGQISLAETELQKASVDASYTSRALEEEMDAFERKKLHDIKKILFDFVNIEMIFHAKAVELCTQMYRNLSQISEEDDLEEFRNSLRPPSTVTRIEMARAVSGSRTSLNSTTAYNTTAMSGVSRQTNTPTATPTTGRHTSNPNNTLGSTNPSSMYSTTTADDDDDDDDDDEEDDDDDDDDDDEEEEEDSYVHHFQAKSGHIS